MLQIVGEAKSAKSANLAPFVPFSLSLLIPPEGSSGQASNNFRSKVLLNYLKHISPRPSVNKSWFEICFCLCNVSL